jgi:hypothetical protein
MGYLDSVRRPFLAAVVVGSDAGMSWLLEHGALATLADIRGYTIAHVLAAAECDAFAGTSADFDKFRSRWLRRVIAAEPSLLEARNGEGHPPLMAAAWMASTAGVATLLEPGADAGAANADGHNTLRCACSVSSLPVVRQLIAAAATSAAALPPGSPQARNLASAAVAIALSSERGCGECAARCGGAGGLHILRAVLAAGGREAVGSDRLSIGSAAGWRLCAADEAARISEGHALTILRALHAGGVDVLARRPADELPILHATAAADAETVVRWLVTVTGPPLEERDSDGYRPLLRACYMQCGAAAHALLDCGARVDVQSTDEAGGWWPVQLVVQSPTATSPCCGGYWRRTVTACCGAYLRACWRFTSLVPQSTR